MFLESDLQQSEEKQAAQTYLLSDLQIQAPDHWHCESQNHEVNQEIGHAVPTVELVFIDACSTFDAFVPIKANRCTFKNGDEESDDVVEDHDNPSCSEEPTKPAYYAKDPVVEEDK